MPSLSPTASHLRNIIHEFIDVRLAEKQKGKSDEDAQGISEKYTHPIWLKDASRRASQLTVVTHAPKFSHPDSKSDGFRFDPSAEVANGLVSSRGARLEDDVFGNAAALDVFQFFQLNYGGESVLSRILRDDHEIASALSDDASTAVELISSFKAIARSAATVSCDTFTKQIYFPLIDGTYHLLGILHPTSLAQLFHEHLEHDKFSEDAKAARESHKVWKKNPQGIQPAQKAHLPEGTVNLVTANSYRIYPDLALRKFGGSKPQNISQLNNKRRGKGYLLASLPPTWSSRPAVLPTKQATIFDRSLVGQLNLRTTFSALKAYYRNPYDNASLRGWAGEKIGEIITQVMALADRVQQAEPGWSMESRLPPPEIAWLDPDRDLAEPDYYATAGWQEIVAAHFANWLNFNLSEKTTVMNQEAAGEWHRRFLKELSPPPADP